MLTEKIKDLTVRILRLATSPIRTLPDFIIIGTQRGGTTSLYNYMLTHPNILPSFKKEVHFFDNNFHRGKRWYKAFFPISFIKKIKKFLQKRDFITGEASPDYIFNPYAAERTNSLLPNVKIIVLLRNPVNRAYSHYYMNVTNGYETLSFEEVIDKAQKICMVDIERLMSSKIKNILFYPRYSYLSRGIYIEQIKKWQEYFPKDQILILESEDFFKNTQAALIEVFDFLNLPRYKIKDNRVYHLQNNPKMNETTRKFLIEYFKPYNKQLYEHFGRKFNWDK